MSTLFQCLRRTIPFRLHICRRERHIVSKPTLLQCCNPANILHAGRMPTGEWYCFALSALLHFCPLPEYLTGCNGCCHPTIDTANHGPAKEQGEQAGATMSGVNRLDAVATVVQLAIHCLYSPVTLDNVVATASKLLSN